MTKGGLEPPKPPPWLRHWRVLGIHILGRRRGFPASQAARYHVTVPTPHTQTEAPTAQALTPRIPGYSPPLGTHVTTLRTTPEIDAPPSTRATCLWTTPETGAPPGTHSRYDSPDSSGDPPSPQPPGSPFASDRLPLPDSATPLKTQPKPPREPPSPPPVARFAAGITTGSAPEAMSACSPTSAGFQTATGHILQRMPQMGNPSSPELPPPYDSLNLRLSYNTIPIRPGFPGCY